MSGKLTVAPEELRASAHAQDAIADDLKKPCGKAVSDSAAAGDSLHGWSVASSLHMISETWQPALDGLQKRLKTGAGNLRDTAENHEWNEQWVDQDFEDFDGDMEDVIMTAPASAGPAATVSVGLPSPGASDPARDAAGGGPVSVGLPRPGTADLAREAVGGAPPDGPGRPSFDTDAMLHAKPAMPVYDPGEVRPAPAERPRGTDTNPFG
ncbi:MULTISPECIES: type VII secretion target [Streptomyces]|uniref:Type VII secretion target n=1 Tax=Streptomyces ramulosus TaxID=47762 RepID=A0ABW1FKL7_9ACTN